MDLLDSILSSMDETATQRVGGGTKQEREERARLQKQKKAEQEALTKWRTKTEAHIQRFATDDSRKRLIFPPMPKPYRQHLHEIAETHDLVGHAFGKEEEEPGRYMVIFKKDAAPTPDEINAIAANVVEGTTQADLEQILDNAKTLAEERKAELERKKAERREAKRKRAKEKAEALALQQKQQHDEEAYIRGLQKRDRRTIEEIQAEMKKSHKKARLSSEGEEEPQEEEEEEEEEEAALEGEEGDEQPSDNDNPSDD